MDFCLGLTYYALALAQDSLLAAWRFVRLQLHRLRGHHDLMVFEHGAVYLECASCGRRTRGWRVTLQNGPGHVVDH